jgi:hypothetical protein
VLRKDRSVNIGSFYSWNETQDIADSLLDAAGDPNWVGSLEVPMGALIAGLHTPGDPITPDMLVDVSTVRPNENVYVPNLDGGTLLHITGNTHDGTLTVDSRFRDTMEVWEIDDRNDETKHSLRRAWQIGQRSGVTADSIQPWDRIGGRVGIIPPLDCGRWQRFGVVMGKEGQVRDFDITLERPAREYVVAVFGTHMPPQLMDDLIADPFTDEGRRNWRRHMDVLKHKHLLLYAAGTASNPCGYWPSTKPEVKQDFPWRVTFPDGHHEIFPTEAKANQAAEGHDGATVAQFGDPADYVTGRFKDDAGFSYFVANETPGVGWVLVWAKGDGQTHVKPGRLWVPQLTDQV